MPKSSISLDLDEYKEIIECLKCLNVNYDGDCDGCDGVDCKRCLMDNKMVKVIKRMEKKVLLLK